MLTELMKQADSFLNKYAANLTDRNGMKNDLWDLIQKAVDLGADKDQSKISGIVGKVIKSFMGKGE